MTAQTARSKFQNPLIKADDMRAGFGHVIAGVSNALESLVESQRSDTND